MSESFNRHAGLIVLPVELFGPTGSMILRMALDTGATRSLVNVAVLVNLGYDPALGPERVQLTTGSGVEFAPLVPVQRVRAIGRERNGLSILAHTLPPSAAIDGLLGLDFFRDQRLEIDFRRGIVVLD